jgi:hypothetical protein
MGGLLSAFYCFFIYFYLTNFFLFERNVYFSCAKQEKYQKKFASVPLDRLFKFQSQRNRLPARILHKQVREPQNMLTHILRTPSLCNPPPASATGHHGGTTADEQSHQTLFVTAL